MDFSLRRLLTSIFILLALLDCCFIVFATQKYFVRDSTNTASNDLIKDVCSGTENPSFCEQTFRSYPNPPPVINLKTLGQISIDVSNATANSTYILIGSLKKQVTDPKILFWLEMCLDTYAYANKAIGMCKSSLSLKDYAGVYKQAFIARAMQVLCDVVFSVRDLKEPPKLVSAGRKFHDLSNIIEVIGKLLLEMK